MAENENAFSDEGDSEKYFDVLIIGAGVSGLCAAYKICKKEVHLSVALLEANDRVGGRTMGKTLRGAMGPDQWDLGGQWIGTCQLEIMSLLSELKLTLYCQYSDGKRLLQVGHSTKAREYSGDIPRLSWIAILDLYLFISKLEGMMELLSSDNQELFHQWDAMTMKSFIDRKLWTCEARESIESALRVVFGCETSHLSLLYLLRYANSAGGFGPLISEKTMYGAQEMKVKGGTFQICPKIVEIIGEQKIHLNRRVTHISQAFWRSCGYSGSVVTNGGTLVDHDGQETRGPLCLIYDATTATGNPALVAFIGGQQHLEHSSKTAEDRKKIVLESLCEYFGAFCLEPLDFAEQNWSANREAIIDGGPVSVGTPGTGEHMQRALTEPFNHVYFAGSESATYWCGFINGAVESGYRAAVEVLHRLEPACLTPGELATCRYKTAAVSTASARRKYASETDGADSAGIRYLVTVVTAVAGVLVAKKLFSKYGGDEIHTMNFDRLMKSFGWRN